MKTLLAFMAILSSPLALEAKAASVNELRLTIVLTSIDRATDKVAPLQQLQIQVANKLLAAKCENLNLNPLDAENRARTTVEGTRANLVMTATNCRMPELSGGGTGYLPKYTHTCSNDETLVRILRDEDFGEDAMVLSDSTHICRKK